MLQPNINEKQASLDRGELADEFLQSARYGGHRPVNRGPGVVAGVMTAWNAMRSNDSLARNPLAPVGARGAGQTSWPHVLIGMRRMLKIFEVVCLLYRGLRR
jgi:hypothetical protein